MCRYKPVNLYMTHEKVLVDHREEVRTCRPVDNSHNRTVPSFPHESKYFWFFVNWTDVTCKEKCAIIGGKGIGIKGGNGRGNREEMGEGIGEWEMKWIAGKWERELGEWGWK